MESSCKYIEWTSHQQPTRDGPGMLGVYRAGSLKTVLRELAKCKLDSVGVQEDTDVIKPADDYKFYGNGDVDHCLWIGFSIHTVSSYTVN